MSIRTTATPTNHKAGAFSIDLAALRGGLVGGGAELVVDVLGDVVEQLDSGRRICGVGRRVSVMRMSRQQ